jgi:hypothetical protein
MFGAMGMFTRLFGGKVGAAERIARAAKAANLRAPSPGEPAYADVVPNEVSVVFYAHDDVDGLAGNFLSAVSAGLSASSQRELVLTLRLERHEAPMPKMQDLIRFLATVHAWAQQGTHVDEGDFTQFGDRGLFGSTQTGLLYTDARALPGVDLPSRALAAVFVDAREIATARDFGTYRVLTRIGAQLRMFPYPTWGALDRPSAITPREGSSVLAKVRRVRVRGASFLLAEQCLRLTIPRGREQVLSGVRSLPAGASFALLLRPSSDANAILVWRFGQAEGSRLAPAGSDGSRVSGSFLWLVPSPEGDRARPVEDGYSLLLSADSWSALCAALVSEQPMSLRLADGLRFELEWSAPGS